MIATVPAAVLGVGLLFLGGAAQAAPAGESPIGGTGAHVHHVVTGNGSCVLIDQVSFEVLARGRHRGATEGEPEHRACP
jgi:hypothetical protein